MEADPTEPSDTLTERLRGRVQELLEAAQRAYPVRPKGPDDTWWVPAHLGGTAPTPAEALALDRGR